VAVQRTRRVETLKHRARAACMCVVGVSLNLEREGCQNEVHLRCGFVVLVYEAAEAVAAVDMAAAG